MSHELLKARNLQVSVDGKEILKGVDLTINAGEIHVLMGPNGAGKSTLVNAVVGHPSYHVNAGELLFEGENIVGEKADARARRGIFLSFQNPEEIPGVTVENFLRTAVTAVTGRPLKVFAFKKELAQRMSELNMDESYASRYLNVGFSGGEKKKNEILQLLLLNPKLAILDETDSGLDVDAVKIVSQGVEKFHNENNALLIITHNAKILESLHVDRVHVLMEGRVVREGGAELVDEIGASGFEALAAQ